MNNDAEVDRRMSAIPSHPSLRHFANGFTNLKQTTGTKHRHIQKVIIDVLAGLVPDEVLKAMRAIIDFIYYSQLETHTSYTLLLLDNALNAWHEHKNAFVRLQIRHELFFRINKFHSMEHYSDLIKELGVADGFNTKLPERLHIEYAKTAYKSTNRKQFLRQMCTYLSRCEAIYRFDGYLDWALSPEGVAFGATPAARASTATEVAVVGTPPILCLIPRWVCFYPRLNHLTQYVLKSPFRGTVESQWCPARMSQHVTQLSLHYIYGTTSFLPELTNYLWLRQPPPATFPTSSTNVFVYNRATLQLSDPFTGLFEERVRAFPVGTLGEGECEFLEGQFDTVLLRDNWNSDELPRLESIHGTH